MTRSMSGIFVSTTWLTFAGSPCFFAVAVLATVTPCDDESEDDVKAAETGAEHHVRRAERDERRERAEEHEGDAHHGDDTDRECAAADEGRPVQQQPRRGNRRI